MGNPAVRDGLSLSLCPSVSHRTSYKATVKINKSLAQGKCPINTVIKGQPALLSPEPLPLVHSLGAMQHTSLVQGLDLRKGKEEAVKGTDHSGQMLESFSTSNAPWAGSSLPSTLFAAAAGGVPAPTAAAAGGEISS